MYTNRTWEKYYTSSTGLHVAVQHSTVSL